MKHLFLPYELALLARDKEFNEPCIRKYDLFNKAFYNFTIEEAKDWNKGYRINKANTHELSIPLYQQIIDWFREKEIRINELPTTGLNPPRWALSINGDFKGGYKIDKAIEKAFKLI